jgi:murein DD-endopeptidase MepM/ murein hydrolase activator NlpD
MMDTADRQTMPTNPMAPRPSVKEMQQRLATELSIRTRVFYTLLLLFDVALGVVVGSLLLTEPELPVRTRLAFAAMVVIAAVWATVLGRTLARRKVLLARHRVTTSRIAVVFTALFTVAALLLAATTPEHRSLGLTAVAFGTVLLGVALVLWRRSVVRLRSLIERVGELERAEGKAIAGSCLLLAMVGLFVNSLAPEAARAQVLTPWPIEVSVPSSPAVIKALGREHLVYEVHLTNFGTSSLQIEELEVLEADSSRSLGQWSDEDLTRHLAVVGVGVGAGVVPSRGSRARTLDPGLRGVVYVWVPLEVGRVPGSIRHRVRTLNLEDDSAGSVLAEAIPVTTAEPWLASAPVDEGLWVALRGPSNQSGHRRSLVTLDGGTRVPQRFAVDWARVGDDGLLFRGDGRSNEDWYGFGEPVRAARGGRIVQVIDGVVDHIPLSPEAAQAFTERDTVTGNTVVVDEGEGRFAVYAHLRNRSIGVKPGQDVSVGAQLGEIGNSGHSLAPHLHFHVGDRPDPLASEGLPYALDTYQLEGRIESLASIVSGRAWSPEPNRPAREVRGELPLENMVVRFR